MADSWSAWGKHVLLELERLNDEHEELRKEHDKSKREIAVLQVKAGVWGAVAGFGVTLVAALIAFLGK